MIKKNHLILGVEVFFSKILKIEIMIFDPKLL